jgi:hypothetical protein
MDEPAVDLNPTAGNIVFIRNKDKLRNYSGSSYFYDKNPL